MIVPVASARIDISNYLNDLIWVYTALIILYIIVQLLFSAGYRPPYARWSDAVLQFLREVCEPYLRVFRRFIPPLGGLDLSPWIAIILLRVVGSVVVSAVHG
jgi:YggT family protein